MPRWRILGLDKENLRRLYVDGQLPIYKIAKIVGHDANTVSRHMKAHGIPLRTHSQATRGKPKETLFIDTLKPGILKKLYNEDWLTTTQIATKFNCNRSTVVEALKRHGIPLHTSRIRGLDEFTLRTFYIGKQWSTIRIAEHFGCKTDETIRKALKKYGIPIRTKSEAGKVKLISQKERLRLKTHLVDLGMTKPGEDHPAWRGGRQVNSYGYVILRKDKKYVLEHRYVMEQHLARKLLSWEEVNHISGNKLDNSVGNLEVIYSEHKHKDWVRLHPN
jgi:hypothetical protein